jgi:hypothetical protein
MNRAPEARYEIKCRRRAMMPKARYEARLKACAGGAR